MMRKVQIGAATLYEGDCLEIMPTLGKVDAVVTDPPYGIKQDCGFGGFGRFGGVGKKIKRREYEGNWDLERPPAECFVLILRAASLHIIWGGNYFSDYLPVSGKWLWWDKCQTMPTYGDGEMAWTSIPGVAPKKFVYNNSGLMAREKDRVHPTQKPVEVMRWCLGFLPSAQTILDPFMGSGTTGVACARMGRRFIGIEKEPRYFDIACKRIEQAYAQPDLFVPQPQPVMEQQEMVL